MKLTIDLDAIIARVKARRAREAEFRRRGLLIFRDWLKTRRPGRVTLPKPPHRMK